MNKKIKNIGDKVYVLINNEKIVEGTIYEVTCYVKYSKNDEECSVGLPKEQVFDTKEELVQSLLDNK